VKNPKITASDITFTIKARLGRYSALPIDDGDGYITPTMKVLKNGDYYKREDVDKVIESFGEIYNILSNSNLEDSMKLNTVLLEIVEISRPLTIMERLGSRD
jgi:hypothetical protein